MKNLLKDVSLVTDFFRVLRFVLFFDTFFDDEWSLFDTVPPMLLKLNKLNLQDFIALHWALQVKADNWHFSKTLL